MSSTYQIPAKSSSDSIHQAFWAEVVVDQSTSGMGMRRFCKHHQLSYSVFNYWKYVKQKTKVAYNANNNCAANIPNDRDVGKFIPLQIANTVSAGACTKNEAVSFCGEASEIKIIFKNEHKLVLPLTTSEANLLLIIKAVAGLRC
jgi:hypothetical protein